MELKQLASTRKHHLVECKQLHKFNRECDEVEQWMAEKKVVVSNEDLGKDLEHVEVGFRSPAAYEYIFM